MLEDIISWQAPEYIYQSKDASWYWISLIAAIILLGFSVWQKNFLFAAFIAIAFIMINSFAGRFPKVWEFQIDKDGVSINLPNGGGNKKFYPFESLESFDVHETGEEYKEIVFKSKSKFSPFFKINIRAVDEEKIKNFLLSYLPYEEHPQSLADIASKLIKF